MFSNACRVLSQCNTRLRLLYLLNKFHELAKWGYHDHLCLIAAICKMLFLMLYNPLVEFDQLPRDVARGLTIHGPFLSLDLPCGFYE